ncbi:unnamed protein product, partial [Didymodactylos carnosus]
IEGTGNGIKTVIVNMTQIAKALSRPPTYVTKFFGCELGAQVQMVARDDRYIVNGAHDAEKLQSLLDGFIKRFVLCPHCDNPETQLVSMQRNRTGGEIRQHCTACGYQGGINMASHRLTAYISRHPPDTGGIIRNERNVPSGDSSNGVVNINGVAYGDVDEVDDWVDNDLSPTDASNTNNELDSNVTSMIQSRDLDKSVAERCEMFLEMLENKKTSNGLNKPEIIKEILAEAERLEIMEKVPFVLAQSLFTENILNEIDTYKVLLLKLCRKTSRGQKYFLHGLETFIGNGPLKETLYNKKSLAKTFLKLYEDGIIEEETFYSWYDKTPKRCADKKIAKKIREMAKEFIEWLKTADEASDEEQEDGEEETAAENEAVAINFSYAADGLEVARENPRAARVEESRIEVNGEIINVDDI